MTISDRGIHPDLLEEETAAQETAPEAPQPPPAPARRNGRARAAEPPAPAPEPPPTAPEPEAPTEPASPEKGEAPATPEQQPEWWDQVKNSSDPKTALALLTKNLSKQELESDPTLQGWIGYIGERRARDLLKRSEQEAVERQKREAAASGDYYGLGQLTATEIQARAQQAATAEQAAPFMDGVVGFQKTLPEDVQREIQGKTFGAGKSYAEGVSEYLDAVTEAVVSHRLTEAIDKEIKRREPVLRKAWLSETNGSAPVPELEGGQASSVREITDEQIDRMSLDEYDQYFDGQGNPKPGVRLRLTRGIPIRQR